MTDTEIIENLRTKLAVPSGRHLYGVLATYRLLDRFGAKLQQASAPNGTPFPAPISVNRGVLDSIPDDEFRQLAEHESKRPEPARAHIARAFEQFLRSALARDGLVILANLELLFAYSLELNLLRTLAADDKRIVLLLPGKRERGRIVLFPDISEGSYTLPSNLIAENHLWELQG